MKIGNGPAAVIPPLDYEGNPFNRESHCPAIWDGKAVERAGKSENLPDMQTVSASWPKGMQTGCVGKPGRPHAVILRSGVFFFSRAIIIY